MEYTPWSLLIDAGFIGLLLVIGTALRAFVPALQTLMIPASVIAGAIGLVLGPNALDLIPFSDQLGTYGSILIVVVFACLSLTDDLNFKKIGRSIASFSGYGVLMYSIQVAVGVLLALLLFTPVFGTPEGFGLLLFAGWAGGYGSAAAIGSVFSASGWEEAASLAFTSATVGLLIGIIGGIILTKIGAVKGHSQEFKGLKFLPDHLRSGLIRDRDHRESIGQATVSASSVESLALQAGVVLAISLGAYGIAEATKLVFPSLSLPLFSLAFLVGLIVRSAMAKTRAHHYVDSGSLRSISGLSTDVLIVCGISSIVPAIVASYWLPLLILFIVGLLMCLAMVIVLGPRMLGENWFEKSIFTWGWSTGAVATGVALLRIADPRLKSKTLENFAISYIPIMPVEICAVTFAPLLVIAGATWAVAGIWGSLAVIALILPFAFGWVKQAQVEAQSVGTQ